MNIPFYIVDPGGNITAIVPGTFSKKTKISIAKSILEREKTVEQVGFWTQSRKLENKARLDMAGGEFCGNALRSLAFLLYTLKSQRGSFLLESSGTTIPVSVTVRRGSVSLKLPLQCFAVEDSVCSLPGISHVITQEAISKNAAKHLLKNRHLLAKSAAGIMSYTHQGGQYILTPMVWVKDTETLYEETACASGSFALAFMVFQNSKQKKLAIRQPSGAVFTVARDNKNIVLTGPVYGMEEQEITLGD